MIETVLGIFCKQPIPGKVKTRLGADIGDEPAARLYEAFLTDIVDRLCEVGDERILCYAPNGPDATAYFQKLGGGDYRLVPQSEGDLGDRLTAFFEQALANGPRKVIVIGSDSPTISRARIHQAGDLLGRWIGVSQITDSVLGMSHDGGYYLIGMRRFTNGVFDGIDWSTASVYDQQQQRLEEAGCIVRRLLPVPEVDTLEDLSRLRQSPLLKDCPNTHRVLSELNLL